MRYLVVSDLHSNIEALDAVIEQARGYSFDRTVCLGDLVGYGASPNEVVDRLRSLEPIAIRGNHDKVIAGLDSGEQFNLMAVQSCAWTQRALSPENLKYLAALPRGPVSVDGAFWIAHGTPLDEDAYILNDFDAMDVFRAFPQQIVFFGHSHLPTIFALDQVDGFYLMAPMEDEERIPIKSSCRYLINCGSVGQPRDRNPKAAYGIYDTDAAVLELHRVSYPVGEAQRRIVETDVLPRFLAERLAYGV